eukprot:6489221-Amphidinium_carterae.1
MKYASRGWGTKLVRCCFQTPRCMSAQTRQEAESNFTRRAPLDDQNCDSTLEIVTAHEPISQCQFCCTSESSLACCAV